MASYNFGKVEVLDWIFRNFKEGESCLDVGACDGKWADLLNDYLVMDACEIFAPNIWRNNLTEKYREIFGGDIADYNYKWYDLVIFGDVIEHMSITKAQNVIEYAKSHCRDMVIAVPYMYPQGILYGNPYEVHVQADLTDAVFNERYPGFELIWSDGHYGYYHRAK